MKCDIGQLQAYLDSALSAKEQEGIVEHLAGCVTCRESLAMLQGQQGVATARLAALDPQPDEASDAAMALARFRTLAPSDAPTQPILFQIWRRSTEMMKRTLSTGRWRPAAIGLVSLALLVALFSLAPVRQAAAQFLGIFRVRKFAVIPIDQTQMAKLESLESLLESGMLGQPTFVRQPSPPQSVADAAEATALAGFRVRVPTYSHPGTTLRRFTVESGPAMRLEVDRATMERIVAATNVQGVTLPPVDVAVVEADFGQIASQEYLVGSNSLNILQLPSPTVTLPPGIDPAMLGEALFRFLGMPAEDAQRMAQAIDWTSTLIIPVPTDLAEFREVGVDGVTGLLLEIRSGPQPGGDPDEPYRRGGIVLWQRDGIVYAVIGENINPTVLLQVADSLR